MNSGRSFPDTELVESYRSWKRRLPELQQSIKNPALEYDDIMKMSRWIRNYQESITTFEQLFPEFIAGDHSNNSTRQLYKQTMIFDHE